MTRLAALRYTQKNAVNLLHCIAEPAEIARGHCLSNGTGGIRYD